MNNNFPSSSSSSSSSSSAVSEGMELYEAEMSEEERRETLREAKILEVL